MKYLKLCRNSAHNGYEDFGDGQNRVRKLGNVEASKLEKVFCFVGIKLF